MKTLISKLKYFVKNVLLKGIFIKTHSLLTKIKVVEKLGFVAFGEKNQYGINPFYTTIDVNDADKIMEFTDKCDQMPIEDTSARIIYSSHNLEHLSTNAAEKFFAEAYRKLRFGGELLIEVPDCEYLYNQFTQEKWTEPNQNILGASRPPISLHDYFYIDPVERELITKLQGKQIEGLFDCPHSTFLFVLSSYQFPAYTGTGGTVVVEKVKFDDAIKNLTMDKFFDWCLDLKSEDQHLSGGHDSIWHSRSLIEGLEKYGFKSSVRRYREAKTLSTRLMVPDRKHRSFYSLRVSAVKL